MLNERIAVLYGGRSAERAGSLISGTAATESLLQQGYDVTQVDPANQNLAALADGVSRCFMALHGWYGEDGKVQGYLDTVGIPYTGCGVLASSVGMNKVACKRLLEACGIPTPRYRVWNSFEDSDPIRWVDDALKQLGLPLVVKPFSGGGSLGITIARDFSQVVAGLLNARREFGSAFVEEFIEGDFLTVGLLGSIDRPHVLEALRVTTKTDFYDYEAKHSTGGAIYEVPAVLPPGVSEVVKDIACRIYRLLGCHGPVRVDMILSDNRGPQVLEVNTTPGLSRHGNLATIAGGIGMSYDELIASILASSLDKPCYVP